MQASIGELTAESQLICLDFGATHTLIDRSLVAQQIMAVTGEALLADGFTGKSSSSKHVNLQLYIHSDDGNGNGNVFIACKAHVVKVIDAGILIGMVLDWGKGKLTMDSHYGLQAPSLDPQKSATRNELSPFVM